jgi:hypothetical protein
MRMEPGAVTIAHDHPGMEEFLILEGDLVDSDGATFGRVTLSATRPARTTTRGRRRAACSPSSSGGVLNNAWRQVLSDRSAAVGQMRQPLELISG